MPSFNEKRKRIRRIICQIKRKKPRKEEKKWEKSIKEEEEKKDKVLLSIICNTDTDETADKRKKNEGKTI